MKFNHAIVGGTFDHFHKGHEKLLQAACLGSERVTIGLATEDLYKNKLLPAAIEDYNARKTSVENFLQEINFQNSQIIPLSDIFGNSLEEKDIEAIFVTEDTLPGAEIINKKRKEIGFKELKIVVVEFVMADDGEKISSDRIRLGEIDRNGFSFKLFLEQSQVLHLPQDLREELRKPIGRITRHPERSEGSSASASLDSSPLAQNDGFIISVGDIVTRDLIQAGIYPSISIIDFKTQRHIIDDDQVLNQLKQNATYFENKAGTINTQFAELFQTAISDYLCHPERSEGSSASASLDSSPLDQNDVRDSGQARMTKRESTAIIVDGEEDLLTLPAVLLAPLGSIVIYGQVDVGAVVVQVSEEKKEVAKKLLEQFT